MKFLCIFASIVLAVSSYRIPYDTSEPRIVECGGWHGFFDVVQPSVTGNRSIIRSYNFGNGDYSDNENCFVQFRTESQALNLRLTFTKFELENSYSCVWDALCVNGFEYCGTTLAGSILSYSVPANNTFTIFFSSDWSITKPGFEVIVDVTPETDDNLDDDYYDTCLSYYQPPTPVIEPFPFYTAEPSPPVDYSELDYPYGSEDYSDGDYPSEDYSDGDFPSEDYSNGDYPSDVYSDGDLPSEDYSNEDYPSDVYSDGDLPSDVYSDGDLPSEDYSNEDYPSDVYGNGDYASDVSYNDYPVPGK